MARIIVPEAEAILDQEDTMLPEYGRAIRRALSIGYKVDAASGIIIGLKGHPFIIALRGAQQYPTICLVPGGMRRRVYSVPAHKVIAYAIWGCAAFQKGIQVRHIDGNPLNIKASNLRLGSVSDNQMDKSPAIRRAAASAARRAQGYKPHNVILDDEAVAAIRIACQQKGPSGRVKRGIVKRLAAQYGVYKSTVSMVARNRSHKEKDGTRY